MLRTRTLVALIIFSTVVCSVGIAFSYTSYAYACAPSRRYDFRVIRASTVDSTGNSNYLKAYVVREENIIWTIRNAYPGEVVYLRFDVQNTGNKPLRIDGFRVLSTSNIEFETSITYSKQTLRPGETIKAEVKLTILKAQMKSIGLFTIKINVLGV